MAGDEVKPNRVLVAPGGKQMGIKALKDKLIVTVTDDIPVNRHKPSVDYLFQSAADLQMSKMIAVLLTGMGSDGALMLKKLRDQKVRTIAQDKESCVVFGMPKEAIKIGAAEFVLPLEKIAAKIIEMSQTQIKKVSGM